MYMVTQAKVKQREKMSESCNKSVFIMYVFKTIK